MEVRTHQTFGPHPGLLPRGEGIGHAASHTRSQTQLSNYERYVITHMHHAGFCNAVIARQVGRHRATIGRELRRNRDGFGVYHYDPAQRVAEHRRTSASRRYKLDTPGSDWGRYVRQKLRQHGSPQQTHARLAHVQQWLNNRPRKCLNYRTSIEALSALPGVALRN